MNNSPRIFTGTEEIEWYCRQIITKLFHSLDNRDYSNLIMLFTPEGLWHRAGTIHKGRDDILLGMEKRSKTYHIRHILSNFLILAENDGSVDMEFYVTAFANDDGKPAKLPIHIKNPHSVLIGIATFLSTEYGYLISELKLTTEFVF
jgi:hypothetical protein